MTHAARMSLQFNAYSSPPRISQALGVHDGASARHYGYGRYVEPCCYDVYGISWKVEAKTSWLLTVVPSGYLSAHTWLPNVFSGLPLMHLVCLTRDVRIQ